MVKFDQHGMDSDDAYESGSGSDSDAELQAAFQSGKLKAGLNVIKEKPVKTFVNNEAGMLAKLEQFRLNLPWLETLDSVNRPAPLAPELKQQQDLLSGTTDESALAQDDFKREALFYRQAQAAVLEGIPKLHALGVKTARPDDYLAQMVKSDEQMDKVRKFLIKQKTSKELSEKARKLRELKKTAKRTQVEAQQRKQREKKEMLERVKKFRRGADQSLDFLEEGNAADGDGRRNKPGARAGKPGKKRPSAKRQEKDTRFGFGGRKRGSKRNTAQSAADTGWLRGKGNKGKKFVSRRAGGGGGGAGGGAQKRPGKQTRQKMRNRNKR